MSTDTVTPPVPDTTPIVPPYTPPPAAPTPDLDGVPPEQQAEPICTPAQDANGSCPKPT